MEKIIKNGFYIDVEPISFCYHVDVLQDIYNFYAFITHKNVINNNMT